MWGELAESMHYGNGYITVMLIISFIGTAVLIERIAMLFFVYNINNRKFVVELKKMILADDKERAMSYCKNVSGTGIPYIALKTLEAQAVDPSSVRGALEETAIEFLPKIESRLNIIPATATLILLTGVLGTIDGLWAAFHSIDVLDTAKKQAILAQGVAGSLAPTSLGLILCMVLLTGSHIVRGIAVSVSEKIHHGVSAISNLLVPNDVAVLNAQPVIISQQTMGNSLHSGGGQGGSSDDTGKRPGENENAFDNVTIDDIKDEEEII
jgi:biopolymer transport protein ExbB/TolQ